MQKKIYVTGMDDEGTAAKADVFPGSNAFLMATGCLNGQVFCNFAQCNQQSIDTKHYTHEKIRPSSC